MARLERLLIRQVVPITEQAFGQFQEPLLYLTTNETYFFREPKHFDFLREKVLPHCRGKSTREPVVALCGLGRA